MSRRLKHLKEQYTFCIKMATGIKSDSEQILRDLVDECIIIYQKYKNKGHTKESEIKHIHKDLRLIYRDNSILDVTLSIHVAHYTKLYFALGDYIAKLNNRLQLQPASITLKTQTPTIMITETQQTQTQPKTFIQ